MTSKGKHASRSPGTFYRDLVIMILGILVVGALVFLILYLIAETPETGPTTTTTTVATTTTSSDDVTTTEGETTTTTEVVTTTVPVRPPGQVTVIVLNSVGLDGAAGRLTTDLGAAGYQTITPDNYQPEQTPSRIWYREGFAPEANVLLEFVPGAVVEVLPDPAVGEGADVIIVLGTGYEG